MEIASKVANIARRTIGSVARRSGTTAAPKQLEKDVAEFSTKEVKPSKVSKLIALIKSERLGLDKKTVRELESLPLEEFVDRSLDIICKAKGIPQELRPTVLVTDLNDKLAMSYDYTAHNIFVNQASKVNKAKNRMSPFSFLRHEFEHANQTMDILRTEGLGEEAAEHFSKIQTQNQINAVVASFKDMPQEQVLKMQSDGILTDEHIRFIKQIKEASSQGDEKFQEFIKGVYDNDFPTYHKNKLDFRQKVIELKGEIKADSKQAKIAHHNYKGFLAQAGKGLGLDYFTSLHEILAYGAQSFACSEYMLRRFF